MKTGESDDDDHILLFASLKLPNHDHVLTRLKSRDMSSHPVRLTINDDNDDYAATDLGALLASSPRFPDGRAG